MRFMEAIWRIIDANLNRAREAMRVAEDYARFVLNDAALSSAAKSMRSDLRRVEETLPAGKLLASRDTPADVGTSLSTQAEADRTGPAGVAVAACKRLTEALRAIEEYLKVAAPASAAAVEALRYRSYTFEQRLLGRADLAGRIRRARLYVLLTSELCKQDPVLTAHAAIAGGADVIQLREKTLSDAIHHQRPRGHRRRRRRRWRTRGPG
jgi:thiamine-phosphate pyrophosphorylase